MKVANVIGTDDRGYITQINLRAREEARRKLARTQLRHPAAVLDSDVNTLMLHRAGLRVGSWYRIRDHRTYHAPRAQQPILARVPRGFALLKHLKKDTPGEIISVEIECFARPADIPRIRERLPLACDMVSDGSLRPAEGRLTRDMQGVEIRVPFTVTDCRRLYKVGELLAEVGAEVNRTAGLHVHLDVRDWSPAKSFTAIRPRAMQLYSLAEHVLRYAVPPSRLGNTYCAFLAPDRSDRYRVVNGTAVAEHGTVELRLGAGSTSPDKIRLWAETARHFLRHPFSRAAMAAASRIRTPGEAVGWVLEHSELSTATRWWLVQRIVKFYPSAVALPSADASRTEGSES